MSCFTHDSLNQSVTFQGGKYNLQIPVSLMRILEVNKRFDGIRPAPRPDKNPDGSFTVRLTITQWQQFQDNVKKPATLLPLEDPSSGRAPEEPQEKPSEEPKEKPSEKPKEKPGDEITVTQEPSTSCWFMESRFSALCFGNESFSSSIF